MKFLKTLGVLSLIFQLFNPASIKATEEISYDQAMALGFDKIKQLDDYKIEFEMMNLDTNLPLYEGVIHGKQSTGDWELEVSFFENIGTEEEPELKTFPFHLRSYHHFYLTYTKQIEQLREWDELNLLSWPQNIELPLLPREDKWVKVSMNPYRDETMAANGLEKWLLIPDTERLHEISGEWVDYHQGTYQVSMERIEIPTNLFQSDGGVQLSSSLLIDFFNDETLKKVVALVDHDFNVQTSKQGVHLIIESSMNLPKFLEEYAWNNEEIEQIQSSLTDLNLNHQFEIDSRHVTNKLTHVSWQLRPRDDIYEISLTGIAEWFDLNLFDQNNTAKLQSSSLCLKMRLSPNERKIPHWTTFDSISQHELNHLINIPISSHSQ